MHDDLTYRQQRNLNLIAESLLTGRSEPAFQAGREAAMLNEQFGFAGRRGPKLTMTMPDDAVADMNPLDAIDIVGDGGEAEKKEKNKRLFFDLLGIFDRDTKLGQAIRKPRRATTQLIRAIDDALGDNLEPPTERKTAEILNLLAYIGLIPSPPGVPTVNEPDPPEDKSDEGEGDDDFDFGG